MNKNIIRLAAIAALAVGAQAGTIVKSGVSPAGWDFTGTPAGTQAVAGAFNYNVMVPQISAGEIPGGSFLIGVSYVVEIGTYGAGTIVSSGSFDLSASLNAGFLVSGPEATSPTFSPATGLVNGSILDNFAGPGAYSTPVDTETSAVLDDTANLASYQGVGNVTFTFVGTADSGVSGPTSGESQPDVFQGARVSVTYTYSDVPEPSTYAAGAVLLAGAGFIARRRMQKA
jgi:hypothetical protein